MDPADVPLPDAQDLAAELARQGARQDQLFAMLQNIAAHLPSVPAAAPPPQPTPAGPSPRLPLPPRYEGDPKACRGFLNQCTIHFEVLPHQFPSDRAKVAFIISLLSSEALAWVTPLWERSDPIVSNLTEFLATFRKIFGEPGRVSSAASSLLRLRQGSSSVGQYAIRFRTLASELAWNNEALVATFWEGLAGRIKDELAGRDLPTTLDDLISLATRIDIRFAERQRESGGLRSGERPRRVPDVAPAIQSPLLPSPTATFEEPMQVGKLSVQERTRRRNNNLCLYCGNKDHFLNNCPVRPGKHQHLGVVGEANLGPQVSSPQLLLPVSLDLPSRDKFQVSAFLDSGSAENFIHAALVLQHHIPVIRLEKALSISSINGETLPDLVEFRTVPLVLRASALHQEEISFYVLTKSSSPLILGLPWLRSHAPVIDWSSGEVLQWGKRCHTTCMSLLRTVAASEVGPIELASQAPPGLPAPYQDYADASDSESELQHSLFTAASISLLEVPRGRTFVPTAQRNRVLTWAHSSKFAGHSGVRKSIDLVSSVYWWPTLSQDVKDYVAACPVCARDKVCHQKPTGLFLPVPAPDMPWAEITMDFITEPAENVDSPELFRGFYPLRGPSRRGPKRGGTVTERGAAHLRRRVRAPLLQAPARTAPGLASLSATGVASPVSRGRARSLPRPYGPVRTTPLLPGQSFLDTAYFRESLPFLPAPRLSPPVLPLPSLCLAC